jgi:hypothetical protein
VSEDIDAIRQLMTEAATTAEYTIAEVVQKLVDLYTKEGLDRTLGQNQMLIALSNVTGQLISCMPENQRDFVESKVLENIPRQRLAGEAYYAKMESGEVDLATVEPAGRC